MRNTLKALGRSLREVFSNVSYSALASALAVFIFFLAVLLPNVGLLTEIFSASRASLSTKLAIAAGLVGGIRTNFSLLSASYTIASAALFGVDVAMVVYFLKRTGRARLRGQEIAAGVGGIASGTLGIGCAACGSFLLTTLLSSLGAAGALAILPLHGGEFGILGVGLLLFSLTMIAKKIAAPAVCHPAPAP
jgi:hypothetical protein